MASNLIAFGCSWTSGYGLDSPTQEAYPTLVANHFNCKLQNLGEPGASNVSITWTLNDWLSKHSEDFISDSIIVAGLTFESRFSWFNAGYEVYADGNSDYKYIDSPMADDVGGYWKDVHKLHYTLSDCHELQEMVYSSIVRQFEYVRLRFGCKVFLFNIAHYESPFIVEHATQPDNLGAIMNEYIKPPYRYKLFQDDGHPTTLGHEFIAKHIIKQIG